MINFAALHHAMILYSLVWKKSLQFHVFLTLIYSFSIVVTVFSLTLTWSDLVSQNTVTIVPNRIACVFYT